MEFLLVFFYNKLIGSRYANVFLLFLSHFTLVLNKINLGNRNSYIGVLCLLHLNYVARYCSTFSKYHELRKRYVNLCILYYGASLKKRKKYKYLLFQLLFEKYLYLSKFKISKQYFDNIDEKVCVADVMNNKKVCYIGSAPTENLGSNDDFDYYIVNNMLLKTIEKTGYPPDKTIVFLNSNFAKTHAKEINDLSQNCALVLFKDSSDSSFSDAGKLLHTDYGAFGAQNVLYYLLKSKPKLVTVAGVNGYTSTIPFTPGRKNYNVNKQHISNILRRHDAVLNHLLLTFLASQLNIVGSDDFELLSKTSIVDYCTKLDQLYADFPAKRIKGYGF